MKDYDFAQKLRTAREELQLTQKQVADELGVAVSTYAHYESGNRYPNLEKIKKLEKILGTNIFCEALPINGRFEFSESERKKSASLIEEAEKNMKLGNRRDLEKNWVEITEVLSEWDNNKWGPTIEGLDEHLQKYRNDNESHTEKIDCVLVQLSMKDAKLVQKMREVERRIVNILREI